MKTALALVFFILLPIDWFSPTGTVLREAGAKPVIVFLFLIFLYSLIVKRLVISIFMFRVLVIYFVIVLLGIASFYLNVVAPVDIFSVDILGELNRNQETQFYLQLAMQIMVIPCLLATSFVLSDINGIVLIKIIERAAIVHIVFYSAEFFGIFSNTVFQDIFRNGELIARASGLMSEPAYYGVFAALYSIPILFFSTSNTKKYGLPLLLIFTAGVSLGKTFAAVLIFQLLYIYFARKNLGFGRLTSVISFLAGVSLLVVVAVSLGTFDLQRNLSSVMRLGSSVTAINLIATSASPFGLGFGQFHFYYGDPYIPDILYLSSEAAMQMNDPTSRASTFNQFLRYWVETGPIGLLLILFIIWLCLRRSLVFQSSREIVGGLFLFGAAGFLMTQDTYLYPPFLVGIALIDSARRRSLAI